MTHVAHDLCHDEDKLYVAVVVVIKTLNFVFTHTNVVALKISNFDQKQPKQCNYQLLL